MTDIVKRVIRDGVVEADALPPGTLRCRRCGTAYDVAASVALWFPTMAVHDFTHSLVIMTHQMCCGATSHTEPVATISAYLRDVKGHARLVCNLMNAHLLAGRPQPQWLTDAWEQWEREFRRPKSR